ncbi:MAG: hypothetical protein L3K52_14935 [Candidatus Thiothrix sulfatifontis]|nr:MAG: hypothetical protein L3K52_14935 [Candidatus Thiothrix sulfatifontis]
MKAIILKPIVWNSNHYIKPSGHKATSGFAKEFGYGHEEWNNSPSNIWRNHKVFHSEFSDSLLNYSNTGDLGIILIASYKGIQYALGIATNVYHNTREDMRLIADELRIYDRHRDLWRVTSVKKAFNNNNNVFLNHWEENYQWIRWRCPQEHFHWFDEPIPLDPIEIIGKEKFVLRHGSHQAISQSMALEIINNNLPLDHEIYNWLTDGEFDESLLKNIPLNKKKTSQQLIDQYNITRRNSTSKEAFEYWIEGKRTINPLHSILQARFIYFLKEKNIVPTEDDNYIDVQYRKNGRLFFSEIKPTDNIETKYAIRSAIGQILEYNFEHKNKANLEIVIGSKPKRREVEFVNSLNIILTYWNGNTFISCTP